MFTIKLVYHDEVFKTLPVDEERLDEFYNCLCQKKLYWFEPNQSGMWTDVEKIRYIQVFKTNENGELEKIDEHDLSQPAKCDDCSEENEKSEEAA
jgi:hypothetical protein